MGYTSRAVARSGIRTWPRDVIQLARGEFDEAARVIDGQRRRRPNLPTAAYFMMDCGSGVSLPRRARLVGAAGRDVVGDLNAHYESLCPVWNADLGDAQRQAFVVSTPTLVIQGTWDVSTPFENALEVLSSLPHGRLVSVVGGGHGAWMDAMAEVPGFWAGVEQFLRTGESTLLPDTVTLPPLDWAIPGNNPGGG